MKALAKIVAVLCLASVCAGFTFAHFRAKAAHQANLVTVTLTETIHTGDRLDNILEQYYNADNEGICWDEFRAKHYDLNAKVLKEGFQPGDKVIIVCKVLKAEK